MKTPTKLLALLSILALASCGVEEKVSIEIPTENAIDPSFADLLLPDAPGKALTVTAARKLPTPGTEIVIAGDIIGKMDVFVENRAMLTIGDPAVITSCNRMPDDLCATPWDVCCDDPEVIKASIATIQILDADGKLIKTGLKGLGGMKELSSVIIKGTVAEGSNADNLLITATGIHIASVEANNTPR
jgi:hypothetical protein